MSETFTVLPDAALRSAFIDAAMVDRNQGTNGTLLFDPAIFDVRIGGDASLAGSSKTIQVPLQKVIITIGIPTEEEVAYTDGSNVVDVEVKIPFTVWANTNADQRDAQQRLLFARDARQGVLSSYGLLKSTKQITSRRRPYAPVEGLVCNDYVWTFWTERSTAGPIDNFGGVIYSAPPASGGGSISVPASEDHFEFALSSNRWEMPHPNTAGYPDVVCLDTQDPPNRFYGIISYPDEFTTVVTFSSAVAGSAYLIY